MADFTPTQAKIMAVLSDGMPHPVEELRQCLPDDLGSKRTVSVHLTAIRKMLRPQGEDIACHHDRGTHCYLHVRLLHSPNDGCR